MKPLNQLRDELAEAYFLERYGCEREPDGKLSAEKYTNLELGIEREDVCKESHSHGFDSATDLVWERIVGALRSEVAETGLPRKPYQFDIEKTHESASRWADWLTENKEKILNGELK